MKIFFTICLVALGCTPLISFTQQVNLLTTGTKTSLRGLSVVDDRVLWVSGSSGTIGQSTDGGATWTWQQVKGFEKRDFRDIEAFDDQTAIILAVDEPASILKTTDGGASWRQVFSDSTKGMFLDAMQFADARHGVVVGDPIDHKAFVRFTYSGGETWLPVQKPIELAEGEAFFAASGSNVMLVNKPEVDWLMVTGGTKSRLFVNGYPYTLPLAQGSNSQGANGVDIDSSAGMGVIVGGDFAHDTVSLGNCALFNLAQPGVFLVPMTAPHGYRSGIAFMGDKTFLCCGTSGVDISRDNGLHWTLVSDKAFHVCKKAKNGKAVFLAGPRGSVARLAD